MTQRRRQVLVRHFWEMGVGIVPRIDERSTLAIRVTVSFLLIRTLRFRVRILFAYVFYGKIIRGDFFSFTARRTLAFHRHHGGMIYQSKCVKMFEGEDTAKKGKGKSVLCQ